MKQYKCKSELHYVKPDSYNYSPETLDKPPDFAYSRSKKALDRQKAENRKVIHNQSSREERPPAESGSGQGVDEVHPGADPVSGRCAGAFAARKHQPGT